MSRTGKPCEEAWISKDAPELRMVTGKGMSVLGTGSASDILRAARDERGSLRGDVLALVDMRRENAQTVALSDDDAEEYAGMLKPKLRSGTFSVQFRNVTRCFLALHRLEINGRRTQ